VARKVLVPAQGQPLPAEAPELLPPQLVPAPVEERVGRHYPRRVPVAESVPE